LFQYGIFLFPTTGIIVFVSTTTRQLHVSVQNGEYIDTEGLIDSGTVTVRQIPLNSLFDSFSSYYISFNFT